MANSCVSSGTFRAGWVSMNCPRFGSSVNPDDAVAHRSAQTWWSGHTGHSPPPAAGCRAAGSRPRPHRGQLSITSCGARSRLEKMLAHRHVHVDIAGAIQRVKHEQVFAALLRGGDLVRLWSISSDAMPARCPPHSVIWVKYSLLITSSFFCCFALHIDTVVATSGSPAGLPSTPPNSPKATERAMALQARATSSSKALKSPLAAGEAAALFDQVLRQGEAATHGHGGSRRSFGIDVRVQSFSLGRGTAQQACITVR
jgi:hypothetical protein